MYYTVRVRISCRSHADVRILMATKDVLLYIRSSTMEGSIGSGHAKMCLMPYANNKGADQPAHPRSLISTFSCSLPSIMTLVSISDSS